MPLKSSQRGLSPYARFKLTWAEGCGSNCCPSGVLPGQPGTRVVLARGQVPCDILFVGEAPGESENVLGVPFVGPAGKLLDAIVQRALDPWQVPGTEGPNYNTWQIAFCNLVCCIPRNEEGGKAGEPDDDQVRCCIPRLQEFIQLANPKLLVCVGKLAQDWLDQGYRYCVKLDRDIPQAHILHPAYLLRQPFAHRGLLRQRCEVIIRTAVEDYLL